MPGIFSEIHSPLSRTVRYRAHAEHFRQLANMEALPRSRAQLLELADHYQQLAGAEPRKPSPIGGWMREAAD